MARVEIPSFMFLSKGMRRKAKKEFKKMEEDYKKFAKLMGKMARQMLEGVKKDGKRNSKRPRVKR